MVWKNHMVVNIVRPNSFAKQIKQNTWKNIILRVNHPKHEKYEDRIKIECPRPGYQVQGYKYIKPSKSVALSSVAWICMPEYGYS